MTVLIYDTTLRDGTQGEGVALSIRDKVTIAQLMDETGISYIEGGWPGSNPRDEQFFEDIKKVKLAQAKVAAFGSTRRSGITCDVDPNIQSLLRAETPVVTIFGKTWRFQAEVALKISGEENLVLIEDSIRYLKDRTPEVIFDAEHFFDGYKDDPEYAIACLRAALRGGADWLTLCETNGGAMTHEVDAAVSHVIRELTSGSHTAPIGIHTHNDCELGVANALAAVRAGANLVQGTVNGVGERCGNANLISIVANLCLKMTPAGQKPPLNPEQLKRLKHLSRTVDETANRAPWTQQPYVGQSAFAHKGGIHVDAIKKDSRTYEHVEPESVGNHRRILVSDLSGRSNVEMKAKELGIDLDPSSPDARRVVARLKQLEADGYEFESAGGSFKLLAMECMGQRPAYFALRALEVTTAFGDGEHGQAEAGTTRARIEIGVGEQVAYTSAVGDGPVHAIDTALRSLIDKFYPELSSVRLVDYKVRVLTSKEGTGSVVRVLIQSSDGDESWGTVGVSPNIIHASWAAMVDALEYKLIKHTVEPYRSSVVPETRPPRSSPRASSV
jgi:2-isopropylmalate synthase